MVVCFWASLHLDVTGFLALHGVGDRLVLPCGWILILPHGRFDFLLYGIISLTIKRAGGIAISDGRHLDCTVLKHSGTSVFELVMPWAERSGLFVGKPSWSWTS